MYHSLYITRYKTNEKYKEEEEELTNLNFNMEKKTTLTLWISPCEEHQQGIYRQKGAPEDCTESRVESRRVAPQDCHGCPPVRCT